MIKWLSAPVDIGNPSISATWEETGDLSSYIADGDTAVMVILSCDMTTTTASTVDIGTSNYGSSDTDVVDVQQAGSRMLVAGVGTNGSAQLVFEWYSQDITITNFYLHGYVTNEFAFAHTNKQTQTLSTTDWETKTAARDGTDSQVGLFVQIGNNGSSYATGYRKGGSTYDNYSLTLFRSCHFLIAVDASRQYQVKSSNATQGIAEIGYLKPGINVTFYDSPTDISLGSTGSYVDYSLGAGKSGAFIENRHASGTTKYQAGWRKNGEATYNPYSYAYLGPQQCPVIADSNGDIEGQIENVLLDSYLIADTTRTELNKPLMKFNVGTDLFNGTLS